jgi:molecular chaperone GrpE
MRGKGMEEKEKICEVGGEGTEATSPPELEKLEREKAELEERLLRLRADFDNFRRRSRQQLAEGRAMAIEAVISSILPVIDNLERALLACEEAEAGSFKAGVELIHRQLLDVLAQEGISPILAEGEPFDPHLHEAVAVEETDEFPEGTVTEELLRGYLIGEKVLRYSKVKVAQGKTTGKDEAEDE